MYGALKSDLAKKHTAFVDMIAAQIAALKWMAAPANMTRLHSSAPSLVIPLP